MLNNAAGFQKIYIAAGYTNLRREIDGLASIIKFNFQLDMYEKDILFLFCSRQSDRIHSMMEAYSENDAPFFIRFSLLGFVV